MLNNWEQNENGGKDNEQGIVKISKRYENSEFDMVNVDLAIMFHHFGVPQELVPFMIEDINEIFKPFIKTSYFN